MALRILVELALLLSPFLVFALYRMAVSEAEAEGRKPWPVTMLFAIGIGLAAFAWFVLLTLDKRNADSGLCYQPSKVVDGKVVQGDPYPCEKDVKGIGVPNSDDPGGAAEGVRSPNERVPPGAEPTPPPVDPTRQ